MAICREDFVTCTQFLHACSQGSQQLPGREVQDLFHGSDEGTKNKDRRGDPFAQGHALAPGDYSKALSAITDVGSMGWPQFLTVLHPAPRVLRSEEVTLLLPLWFLGQQALQQADPFTDLAAGVFCGWIEMDRNHPSSPQAPKLSLWTQNELS